MDIDEITYIGDDGTKWFNMYSEVVHYVKSRQEEYAPKSSSNYVGEIGDKVELRLTLVGEFYYETHITYRGETHWIYKFEDSDGNMYVWNTTSYPHIDKGNEYLIKATVKDHKEYKGVKETYLTRCRIAS